MPIIHVCPYCGKTFRAHQHDGYNHCSMACARASRFGTPKERFDRNLPDRPVDACWMWQGLTNKLGYGRIYANGRYQLAHRFAYELLVGPIRDGMLLRHGCDTPACCNPAHLTPGTDSDNSRDKMKRGRFVPLVGSAQSNAKLTDANVRQIRELIHEHLSDTEIARQFGVSDSAIHAIRTGKAWRHVD